MVADCFNDIIRFFREELFYLIDVFNYDSDLYILLFPFAICAVCFIVFEILKIILRNVYR